MEEDKGKRDNVATIVEYQVRFQPSAAAAPRTLFLALKLAEDRFWFSWISCYGEGS